MTTDIDAMMDPLVPWIGTLSEGFARSSEPLFAASLNILYKSIFSGEISLRKVFDIMGSGPFRQDDIHALVQRMGLFFHTDPEGENWDGNEVPEPAPPFIFILGREDFGPELLQTYLSNRFAEGDEPSIFLAQEDFLNYWLFGVEPNYMPGDPRIEAHPGLAFLAANDPHPWPWPSTEVQPGAGLTDTGEFSVESELKRRFGYSVSKQKGLTDSQRQRILDRAVPALTLFGVAHHLAFLVRFNKARRDPEPFQQAIAKWERDLHYLKRTYYRNQFSWPSTDPD